MSYEPLDYVRPIVDEVEYLLGASTNLQAETFFADAALQRAFIRGFGVIGEATRRLPAEFCATETASG